MSNNTTERRTTAATRMGRLFGMPAAERWLLLEAAGFLGLARLLLLTVPFRRIVPWLERRPGGTRQRDGTDDDLPRHVRRAVLTAARHVPWKAVCLPQAMAAKFMLARRGCASTLHLGVARGTARGLLAHAWLEAEGTVVVGAEGMEGMAPIARFGGRPSHPRRPG